jgi:hypothetical protein
MTSLPQLATVLQQVLRQVPLTLDHTSGFCQRHSKCSAAHFVQTTVLGWAARPAATLAELAGVSALGGVPLSPQALDQRLRAPASARLLEGVLAEVVAQTLPGVPVALPLLARFPAVLLLDSTTVVLPEALATFWAGCGGSSPVHTQAAVKLGVCLDLVTGQLAGPHLSAGRQQDRASGLQHAPVPPGALRIADRGYWSLAVLTQICADGGHFLSYLPVQTHLYEAGRSHPLDLLPWLETHAAGPVEARQCEASLLLGKRAQLPVRLLAWEESAPLGRARAERVRTHARHKGDRPSRRALARTGWTLIVTSLPAAQLSAAEARALLGARWQIELLFKCWKALAQLDCWRTTNPERIQCEVLAKTIGCVLQHWLVCTAWDRPDRSYAQALALIRAAVLALLLALAEHARLLGVLHQLADALHHLPGVQPRPTRPATFQQLANPPNVP